MNEDLADNQVSRSSPRSQSSLRSPATITPPLLLLEQLANVNNELTAIAKLAPEIFKLSECLMNPLVQLMLS